MAPARVPLEQQADAVVVEPLPGVGTGVGPRRRGPALQGQGEGVGGDLGHRQVGDLVEGPEALRVGVEGELGVGAVELAPQQPRRDRQRPGVVHGDGEAVVGHVRRPRPDGAHVHRRVDVLGVAAVDGPPLAVDEEGLVEVGRRVHVAVGADSAAARQDPPLAIGHRDLQPALVGIVGAAREGVAHAEVAHRHVDLQALAGRTDGGARAGWYSVPRSGRRRGGDVDAQLRVAQEGLDARDRIAVAAQEGQGRVHRQEAVGTHVPVLGRHVPLDGLLQGHVAVLAEPPVPRQVEGARGVEGDAAVVPVVVLVLAAQPAVAVEAGVEAHLVAGGAELGGLEEGLEHLGLVHRGPRLQGRVVEQPQDPVLGVGEQVGVLLVVGDVVVGVARDPVDVVDGVAGEAGEPRLRLGRSAVDLVGHLAGQHQRRVVAPGAPLRLHQGLAPCQVLSPPLRVEPREVVDVGLHLGIEGGRADPHVVDRRLVEGVVEGGEAVGRGRPLGDHRGVAALAVEGPQPLADHEALLVDLAVQELLRAKAAPGDDPRRQVGARGRRRGGGEEGALEGDEVGGHELLGAAAELPLPGPGAGVGAAGEGLESGLGICLAVVGEAVDGDGQPGEPPRGQGHDEVAAGRGLPDRDAPVGEIEEGQGRGRGHVAPPGPGVVAAVGLGEDEQARHQQRHPQGHGGETRVDRPPPVAAPDRRQVPLDEGEGQDHQDDAPDGVGEHHRLVEPGQGDVGHREVVDAEKAGGAVGQQVEGVGQHQHAEADDHHEQPPLEGAEAGAARGGCGGRFVHGGRGRERGPGAVSRREAPGRYCKIRGRRPEPPGGGGPGRAGPQAVSSSEVGRATSPA